MTHVAGSVSTQALPGYAFVETLYQGARTTVHRAIETDTQQPVVVKVLSEEYPSFGELVQFRNQYTVAKNLPIPGIVRPFSLETYGNGYALVMEAFEGSDLGEYIKQQPLSLIETLGIAIQLADSLHELHQHRVIHKDIKPANILIHPDSKRVKLIDFSIASLLPKETQTIQSPKSLEGTLAYLAPEQTGRMNRAIDYRTDFYALGVTLYELLTGQLPFTSDDPLALIHCHMAQLATAADQLNPEVPPIVAAIVGKLMAKNAEDRYQSALGLKYDLEQCLIQWKEQGDIAEFSLGQRDLSDRFLIPEKLYGRESEVQTLLESFDRAAQGNSELMLVAGFSGIGKTAVVNEVHKPITEKKGYFIKGKFDQFNRNIPFSAFVQAFQDLVTQLFSESDRDLQYWKTKILEALGENAQVIIDLIPALEKILGPQSPAPELSGTGAQNRFNLLFQKFIQVFATPDHPLVIFVDDLQWADSASLNLIQVLMTESETGNLLLMGAYRDNEVFPAHPLMLTLDKLDKERAPLHTLTLEPLSDATLNELIADTLHAPTQVVQPLTTLVMQKTQGNPFFATQFLNVLHQDQLISFNAEAGYWQCDITEVQAAALTDDVVELMAAQLKKLPAATQEILKLAACIGAQFDLDTLALVSEASTEAMATDLWKALQEGLILPASQVYKFFQETDTIQADTTVNPNYRFLHDRVQQAAYSLITEEKKQTTHLTIGRQLWHNLSSEELEEQLFTVINHLNSSQRLITESSEKAAVAKLNLRASQKAKAAVAYEASCGYCQVGKALLKGITEPEVTTEPKASSLWFELSITEIESEFFAGNLSAAETLAQELLGQSQTLIDRIRIHELQILFEINKNRMTDGIALAIDVLAMLDIHLPQDPQAIQEKTQALHQEIALPIDEISELANLETLEDAEKIAAIRVLTNACSAAYIATSEFYPMFVLQTAQYCMQYGNSAAAASVYGWYGALLCGVYDEIEAGYEFGKLSLTLLEKFNAKTLSAKVKNMFNIFIRPWKEPLNNSVTGLLNAVQDGFDNGDVEYALYSAVNHCNYSFFAGKPLDTISQAQERYLKVTLKAQYSYQEWLLRIYQQVVANLSGQVKDPQSLKGVFFDPDTYLPQWKQYKIFTLLLCFYEAQTCLTYLLGDYSAAVLAGEKGCQYQQVTKGTAYCVEHGFYYSLSLLTQKSLTPIQLDFVANQQQQLKELAAFAPANFQHKYDLVEAERARQCHDHAQAISLYDRAITGAAESDLVHEVALANELAAKFYLDWGKEKVAAGYMQEAYYGYGRWGAKAKIADLETRYAPLLRPILQQSSTSVDIMNTLMTMSSSHLSVQASSHTTTPNTSLNQTLDFVSILKASQAMSSTIELDKLLCQLTQIILQNSGGDRCALMLPSESGEWQVRAMATPEETQLYTDPLANHPDLPVKLIQYVKNVQEVVVIDDLETDLPVVDDYLQQSQPKSVLCLPIFNQGNLIGILSLKNSHTSGSFTSDRILVLDFLCTQSAISLENARLYQQSHKHEQYMRSIYDGVSHIIFVVEVSANQDFRWLGWNTAAEKATGISNYDVIGKSAEEIFGTLEGEVVTGHMAECVNTGQMISYEESLTFNDELTWWLTTLTPLYDEANRIYRIIGTTMDITSLKETEAALRESKASLAQKATDLTTSMEQLQQAQLKLVQGEKMSALGGLVAGVAHEINNPVGCIIGNVGATNSYINDLLGLLDLYAEEVPKPSELLEEELETVDLDYVREDLPKLIRAMKDSGDRIKSISKSLRTFSRADTESKQAFDLHEGIDSTLLILRHRLKANEQRPEIDVVKAYGDIPAVDCFPGQLNQVFMNLLANAIDVLDEVSQHRQLAELKANPNRITIRTSVENHQVTISISDNGPGIPEAVKAKIFDHLFTTKAVGKGTGLGLAIGRQIVAEAHGGSLDVRSEVGQGTAFCICLPIA